MSSICLVALRRFSGRIRDLDVFEVILANGIQGVVICRPVSDGFWLVTTVLRTNAANDSTQAEASNSILEKIRSAGSNKSRSLSQSTIVVG